MTITTRPTPPGSLAERIAAARPRTAAADAALRRVRLPAPPAIVSAADVAAATAAGLLDGAELDTADLAARLDAVAAASDTYARVHAATVDIRQHVALARIEAARAESVAVLAVVRAEIDRLVDAGRQLFGAGGPLHAVDDAAGAIAADQVTDWRHAGDLARQYTAARAAQLDATKDALCDSDSVGGGIRRAGNVKAVADLVQRCGYVQPRPEHDRYGSTPIIGAPPWAFPWITGDRLADFRWVCTAADVAWVPDPGELTDAADRAAELAAAAEETRRAAGRVRDLGVPA